jgi:competence protein ComEA
MIYTYLKKPNTRAAQSPRYILSLRRAVKALAFMSVLVAVPFLNSSIVRAEEKPPAVAAATVNINTANAQTLAEVLEGVGQSRAQEIVQYRETYGPFASVDELTEVKGIGKSTLESNRTVITLE